MDQISRRQAIGIVAGTGIGVTTGSIFRHVHADESQETSSSLSEAIKRFNEKYAEHSIGKWQPPLTEDEVVAAIRWSKRTDFPPVTEEEYQRFRSIVDSRRLPAGSEFEVLTGFEPDHEYVYEAWSVRIRMPRNLPEFPGWTYAYTIRERMISSRRIGPQERKVINKWEEKWKKQGGIASFDRIEYARERASAIEKDRKAADNQ